MVWPGCCMYHWHVSENKSQANVSNSKCDRSFTRSISGKLSCVMKIICKQDTDKSTFLIVIVYILFPVSHLNFESIYFHSIVTT